MASKPIVAPFSPVFDYPQATACLNELENYGFVVSAIKSRNQPAVNLATLAHHPEGKPPRECLLTPKATPQPTGFQRAIAGDLEVFILGTVRPSTLWRRV